MVRVIGELDESVAVVDIDIELVDDGEAEEAGEFDAGVVGFWSDIEGEGLVFEQLCTGKCEVGEFDGNAYFEELTAGCADERMIYVSASELRKHLDDGAGEAALMELRILIGEEALVGD